MPPRFVARQLSCPSGIPGGIIRWLMNRGNARMNLFAVEQLELLATDDVLEVGFGGGITIPALLARAASVTGVDRSPDVIRNARVRYSSAVQEGRARFQVGRVESLPFPDAQFTKICTVNTVYFWESLDLGFSEILRVLVPGGRIAVGFLPKQWMDRKGMPRDIFTSRTTEELTGALRRAGFGNILVQRADSATPWNVLVAERVSQRRR